LLGTILETLLLPPLKLIALLGGGKMLVYSTICAIHSCCTSEIFDLRKGEVYDQPLNSLVLTTFEKKRVRVGRSIIGRLPQALFFCFVVAISLSAVCIVSKNTNFAEEISQFGLYFLATGILGELLLALKKMESGISD
jgi:hypothetical protein